MKFIECVADWFRPSAKSPSSSSRIADVAVDVLSVAPVPVSSVVPIPSITATTPAQRGGGIGIQGSRPIVTVSRNRTRCDGGCGELVFRDVRHICIYNAHHHLDSLTTAERDHLIRQLQALGVKPSAARTVIREGTIKTNLKDAPIGPRPPPPKAQIAPKRKTARKPK